MNDLAAPLIVIAIVGYILIVKLFQRDPLPKKLPNCVWHTTVRLDRVYDGDTFYGRVKGHHPINNKPVGIRIRGIDTAEIRGTTGNIKNKAIKAKEIVALELKNARTIHLYNVNLEDKYGRVLADVFCDHKDLAKLLLKLRLAKKYDGGKKEGWK